MDEEEKVDTLPVTSSDTLVEKVRIMCSCFAFTISQLEN